MSLGPGRRATWQQLLVAVCLATTLVADESPLEPMLTVRLHEQAREHAVRVHVPLQPQCMPVFLGSLVRAFDRGGIPLSVSLGIRDTRVTESPHERELGNQLLVRAYELRANEKELRELLATASIDLATMPTFCLPADELSGSVTLEQLLRFAVASMGDCYAVETRETKVRVGPQETVGDHPPYERRTYRVTDKTQQKSLAKLPRELPELGIGCAYAPEHSLLSVVCECSAVGLYDEVLEALGMKNTEEPPALPDF